MDSLNINSEVVVLIIRRAGKIENFNENNIEDRIIDKLLVVNLGAPTFSYKIN